jgi:hypothetical protein
MTRLALALSALALSALALPSAANAADCAAVAKQANAAEGEALVTAYKAYLQCDKAEAEAAFFDLMTITGDVDTLVDLSIAAIEAKAFAPVWNSLDKIKDYSARDKVAAGIGEACATKPDVVVYLKGAYFGLKDIKFAQWDDAYVACDNQEVDAWLQGLVEKPPNRSYDEKYNTLLSIWVKRKAQAGLGNLKLAAIAAAAEGPFSSVLDAMNQAVQPTELGADMTDEDRKTLEKALVEVASAVDPEKAKLVADMLFNAGAEKAAASLLPKVYPDRVQADGRLLYGVATVETCDKEVVIHFAQATDPAARWAIGSDVEAPARTFKPRLKCTAEAAWPVLVTPEPVANAKAVSEWVTKLQSEWTGKGFDVKLREEKAIAL